MSQLELLGLHIIKKSMFSAKPNVATIKFRQVFTKLRLKYTEIQTNFDHLCARNSDL